MQLFTNVLAQMYEKKGLTIPQHKAADHIMEEFEIDTTEYDKDELAREIEELKPCIRDLEAEKQQLTQ